MPLGGEEVNSGYKGYGLAMMADLFCGLLSGSKYAHHIRFWTDNTEVADLGQCFVAIDPECFAPGLGDRLKVLFFLKKKMGHPSLFFVNFGLFQTNIKQFLKLINAKNIHPV